jgi:predicted DNA-binding transcriptional regulator YafY
MVIMLVNHRRIKAKELAEHFGVSVRTVYRDAETISLAGIPVVSFPGAHGGLGIADGFRLDRTAFSDNELASVMMALKSVAGTYTDVHNQAAQGKIQAIVTEKQADMLRIKTESVRVDPSPWGHTIRIKQDIELLKNAIERLRTVIFVYSGANGKTEGREVEPYTLVLKNHRWYLYAYCLLRDGFRFFKLARMKELKQGEASFIRRQVNLDDLPWEQQWQKPEQTVELVLRFPAELKTLAEDWFGVEQVMEERSACKRTIGETGGEASGRNGKEGGCASSTALAGSLLVHTALPENEWLYSYLLSFGPRMEVMEPARLRERIRSMAEQIVAVYSER